MAGWQGAPGRAVEGRSSEQGPDQPCLRGPKCGGAAWAPIEAHSSTHSGQTAFCWTLLAGTWGNCKPAGLLREPARRVDWDHSRAGCQSRSRGPDPAPLPQCPLTRGFCAFRGPLSRSQQ